MTTPDSTGRPEIAAALVIRGKLGVTPADFVAGSAANRPVVPTFAEFLPRVINATTARTQEPSPDGRGTAARALCGGGDRMG